MIATLQFKLRQVIAATVLNSFKSRALVSDEKYSFKLVILIINNFRKMIEAQLYKLLLRIKYDDINLFSFIIYFLTSVMVVRNRHHTVFSHQDI